MSFTLESRISELTAQLQQRAHRVVVKTAATIEAEAKISMTGKKSGRIYRVRGGIEHQASAPGEAPAVETANLITSIAVVQESDLRAIVGTSVEYGLHLEFGTSRMGPRPWLGPAFEKAKDIFEAGIREILNAG